MRGHSARAVAIVFLALAACSGRPSKDSTFAGTWVMNVEGRPLMVLTLESESERYTGTLAHPREIRSDGRSFSKLSQDTETETLTAGPATGGTLRLVATKPGDAKETTEFDFSVDASGNGRLKPTGAPIEPWTLVRHTGSDQPQVWNGWDAKRSYLMDEPYIAPNAAMAEIYKADQAVRQSMASFNANAAQIEKDDAARREHVRALLEKGELRAGEDFRLAALVFQHGSEPRDYLFAHTLALVALAKGDRSASWIASASLDRYLQSIGQPQIFGAGFGPDGKDQGPFDRDLVSDAIRRELNVPVLAEQRKVMEQLLRK
jgi:hypothetical protein